MFWEGSSINLLNIFSFLGGLKLVEKNNKLELQFVNKSDGSLVAVSPLPEDPY